MGRTDDVIKVNGKRTSVLEIEQSMERILNLKCTCLLADEKIVAFIVSDEGKLKPFGHAILSD